MLYFANSSGLIFALKSKSSARTPRREQTSSKAFVAVLRDVPVFISQLLSPTELIALKLKLDALRRANVSKPYPATARAASSRAAPLKPYHQLAGYFG